MQLLFSFVKLHLQLKIFATISMRIQGMAPKQVETMKFLKQGLPIKPELARLKFSSLNLIIFILMKF